MAFTITYQYQRQHKTLGYANDKFHTIYDAIAHAEGLDLSAYYAMEAQVAQRCRRDSHTLKEYRANYFQQLGFSHIVIERNP